MFPGERVRVRAIARTRGNHGAQLDAPYPALSRGQGRFVWQSRRGIRQRLYWVADVPREAVFTCTCFFRAEQDQEHGFHRRALWVLIPMALIEPRFYFSWRPFGQQEALEDGEKSYKPGNNSDPFIAPGLNRGGANVGLQRFVGLRAGRNRRCSAGHCPHSGAHGPLGLRKCGKMGLMRIRQSKTRHPSAPHILVQCHSNSSFEGSFGKGRCGSFWYQNATEAMSSLSGK